VEEVTVHTRSVVAVDVSLWSDDVEVEGEDCDVLRILDVCEGWFGFTPLQSTVEPEVFRIKKFR